MNKSQKLSVELAKIVKRLINKAKAIPCDCTREIDEVMMVHASANDLRNEFVIVCHNGILWRSTFASGKWSQISKVA